MPSAANIIIFQLHQKRHGIKKTQDWHFAPWAFSLLLEPVKVFEGPWKCPWGPFLESLCQLRMIAVARLTVHKPKMSTENAATDRKLFVWRFPLTFLREIWLLTYTWELDETWPESVRGGDEMYLYMMKIMKPLCEWVWPLMTIRKRRWGVRLSEELGEAEKKIRGLEEFRKNLPPFWKNLNRPCPSQRNFWG